MLGQVVLTEIELEYMLDHLSRSFGVLLDSGHQTS